MATHLRPREQYSQTRPDPVLARALIRWQRAAGPYWQYVCPAPFLGTLAQVDHRPASPSRRGAIAARVDALAGAGGVAVFVDLAPTQVLPVAPLLAAQGFLVVPIIQRWIARPAVLSPDPLLSQLVSFAGLRRPAAPRGVVFVLDGERAGRRRQSPPGAGSVRAFDNRYEYRLDRFPTPAFLRDHGITRCGWVVRSALAIDLLSYAEQLLAGGLSPLPLSTVA